LEAFKEFKARFSRLEWHRDTPKPKLADETAFADFIGADLVRYPYKEHAYVIKNGAAIAGYEGETLKLMTLPDARNYLAAHQSEPDRLKRLIEFDPSLSPHVT